MDSRLGAGDRRKSRCRTPESWDASEVRDGGCPPPWNRSQTYREPELKEWDLYLFYTRGTTFLSHTGHRRFRILSKESTRVGQKGYPRPRPRGKERLSKVRLHRAQEGPDWRTR